MPDEPTLGELIRRLADITAQLGGISNQLRTDFVRKETYEAHRDLTHAHLKEARDDITELKNQRATDQNWRRSMSLTTAIAGVGWLLTIVGLVLAVALR